MSFICIWNMYLVFKLVIQLLQVSLYLYIILDFTGKSGTHYIKSNYWTKTKLQIHIFQISKVKISI